MTSFSESSIAEYVVVFDDVNEKKDHHFSWHRSDSGWLHPNYTDRLVYDIYYKVAFHFNILMNHSKLCFKFLDQIIIIPEGFGKYSEKPKAVEASVMLVDPPM